MQSIAGKLAYSHLRPTLRASPGSTLENRQPEGVSEESPRRVHSGPTWRGRTRVRERLLLDGKAPTARTLTQHLRHDRDRQPDARGSAFQVLRVENRSTESVRAVPLQSSPRLRAFRARAIRQPVLPPRARLPGQTGGFSSESLSPAAGHPGVPALRQGAMRLPHGRTAIASLPGKRQQHLSLARRPRARFPDNTKSRHRWYFDHERQPDELPLLQNTSNLRQVVPPPSIIQSLRTDFDFGLRRPVIFTFRLPQKQSILAVLEFKRILPAGIRDANLSLPNSFRCKISFLVEQGSISVQNSDRSIREFSIGIEGDHRPVVLSLYVNYASKIRAGNPIRLPDGHPVFSEGYVLSRLEECICLLISEKARLQLDIGAIVVGECVAPIKAIRVNTPGPDFLGG